MASCLATCEDRPCSSSVRRWRRARRPAMVPAPRPCGDGVEPGEPRLSLLPVRAAMASCPATRDGGPCSPSVRRWRRACSPVIRRWRRVRAPRRVAMSSWTSWLPTSGCPSLLKESSKRFQPLFETGKPFKPVSLEVVVTQKCNDVEVSVFKLHKKGPLSEKTGFL